VNGYVGPKGADPVQATRESLDLDIPMDDLLKRRAGTLIGSACGVSPNPEQTAWVVAFCYDPRQFAPSPELADFVHTVGRGVVISNDGRPPYIVHQDLMLTSPTIKRLAGMKVLDDVLQQSRASR
jgi:hypothetical protein